MRMKAIRPAKADGVEWARLGRASLGCGVSLQRRRRCGGDRRVALAQARRLASSGLHHASAAHGNGFRTFNGLALAARAVLDAGAGRVLILDLDAHCGGGTDSIVRHWPGVVHLDMSVSPFDGYKLGATTRSTLDVVTDAAGYISTLRRRLSDLHDLDIDVVIYNAGVDPHHHCEIGGLRGMTHTILMERERLVFDWATTRRVPVAFVLAGGYVGRRLSEERLVGLHRLTTAAAAVSNAGEILTPDRIRDLAACSSANTVSAQS
jgi:acetoin utilization deacetylase AcuC-like enzyme